jgi:non-lysosomal glucosylceramidase
MKAGWKRIITTTACVVWYAAIAQAGETAPAAAWKRPIGLPLENPGTEKPSIQYPHIDDGYWQGAPVGGFGAGSFSRSYRGDFVRWHLKTGVHKYETVAANQFAVYQQAEGGEAIARVLYTGRPQGPGLSSWQWEYPVAAGDYYALYPKSWFDYRWEAFPARLAVEQFSPILPHNYEESSYPVALYHWHAHNPGERPVTVGILLSWTNMVGWFRDFSEDLSGQINMGNVNRRRTETVTRGGHSMEMQGIVFDRVRQGPVREEWDGQFAIAAAAEPGVEISYLTTFSPADPGAEIWQPFSTTGRLPDLDLTWTSSEEPLAGAIAVTFTLGPGERKTVPMVVSWDLPVTQFGHGRKWLRRYTDFFGTEGQNAWAIARAGLTEGEGWSAAIDRWQASHIADDSKPLWYRGMLFNELYILADGGSLWGRPMDAVEGTPPTFSFLECFDYAFYSTLDVRFYGSMPLAELWPEIDKQVLRVFADTVTQDLTERYLWVWKTQQERSRHFRARKARGAVPHDLGHPKEDPVFWANQFSWQNTNRWKDLNSKFVLMVWRDFVRSGGTDMEFLRYCWPAVREALDYLRQFDTNGDGLPENEGFPDQTYDVWVVEGESAYVGSLWLAALRAAEEMAGRLGEPEAAAGYRALFERSQRSYIDKLWNGEYFRYDTRSEYRDNIMADQLAGQWYANLTGLGDIVPRQMRLSSLRKIFDNNVMKFGAGEMGAANGIAADGTLITTNEQVQEVWTGTTLGLASLMLSEGMPDEAWRTAWGIYNVVYDRYGYWFRTPEAWDLEGHFRASMYMRPAAIWSMEMVPDPDR